MTGETVERKPFMNVAEAADFLCVAKSTLYHWAHDKLIPCRKHGRRLVFVRSQLEAWSAAREQPEGLACPTPFQRARERLRSLKAEVPEIRPTSERKVG